MRIHIIDGTNLTTGSNYTECLEREMVSEFTNLKYNLAKYRHILYLMLYM